jgi:4-hydroxy-3-methylbut-2-en-1-yl diphosphate reductase
LLETEADLAIVVGGFNSSNTSHLVELCEEKFPTYFIRSEEDIISSKEICHFNLHKNKVVTTISFLPEKKPVQILLTSGASCPDAVVENVIKKIISFYKVTKTINEIIIELEH